MIQSRRWAAWIAAFLVIAGLAVLPRESKAAGCIDLIDPVLFGDPDEPGSYTPSLAVYVLGRVHVIRAPWLGQLVRPHETVERSQGPRATVDARSSEMTRGAGR